MFQGLETFFRLRIAHEHLKICGIDVDVSRPGSDKAISNKFLGLYGFMSGALRQSETGEKEKDRLLLVQAFRTLDAEEANRLRKGWLPGWRAVFGRKSMPTTSTRSGSMLSAVVCPTRGISSVRVEGKLNPPGHDHADWWTLAGYDPASMTVSFPMGAGCQHEIFIDKQTARMHVAATKDEPASYVFELKPAGVAGSGHTVVVRDSSLRPSNHSLISSLPCREA